MTVINPNSISGITSITLPAGADNVLTIHTNDGTERFRIDSSGNVKVGSACTISPDGDVFFTGVTTATTFTGAHSGSGANLTSLPAAQITGTLPAISAANLTNVPAANITGTLPAIDGSNLTGIGGTDFIHAEQISVSGVTTSQAFIPLQGQLSNRNLVINGDMRIAQRGTSSTSQGYQTCDRWRIDQDSGLTEACTQSQVTLSSSDTPYASGFRHAFRITNGNQTSQDANDYIQLVQKIEAQDIDQCGWNSTSTSDFITLQFWVKASIAQTFYVKIEATDASKTYTYPIAVTTSWQRLTTSIPGASGVTFNNDTGVGMRICIIPYYGTSYTTSGHSINTWITSDGANQTPDFATTWFSGNDATFDVTGVQLEVGQVATPFEHRKFAEELSLCQRYYQRFESGGDHHQLAAAGEGSSACKFGVPLCVPLRAAPTVACGNHRWYRSSSVGYTQSTDAPTNVQFSTSVSSPVISIQAGGHTTSNNEAGVWTPYNNNDLTLDSEL